MEGAASETGSAGGTVAEVAVELGGRPFRPAVLSQDETYRYQECQLPPGSYAGTGPRDGRSRRHRPSRPGRSCRSKQLQSVTATWQEHQSAGRIRVYLAPCPTSGSVPAMPAFPQIFQANGFNPFPLFSRAGGTDWFLDPANIP